MATTPTPTNSAFGAAAAAGTAPTRFTSVVAKPSFVNPPDKDAFATYRAKRNVLPLREDTGDASTPGGGGGGGGGGSGGGGVASGDTSSLKRAYHLARFVEPRQDDPITGPSNPYELPIRVRREIVPSAQLTEEEIKAGLAERKRRPGESMEEYEERRRLTHVQERRWVIENGPRTRRYFGKEDLGQTSFYVAIVQNEDGTKSAYRVDRWIDFRLDVDLSKGKEAARRAREDEAMRRARSALDKSAAETVRGKDAAKRDRKPLTAAGRALLDRSVSLGAKGVVGASGAPQSSRKRSRFDENDGEDEAGGAGGGGAADDDNNNDADVDHEHELAVDRMAFDTDEFGDYKEDFQDDDDGGDVLQAEEDLGDLLEARHIVEGNVSGAGGDDEDGDDEDDEDDDDFYEDSAKKKRAKRARGGAASGSASASAASSRPSSAAAAAAAPAPVLVAQALLQSRADRAAEEARQAAARRNRRPTDPLEDAIVMGIRTNGGRVTMHSLLQVLRDRGIDVKAETARIKSGISSVAKQVQDNFDGKMYLVLKPDYA